MPQMTNPDGGCERIHMPRATAKGERGTWVKRRALDHAHTAWKEKQGVICGLWSTKDKVWPKKAWMLWRMWGIYDGSSSHCKKRLPKASLCKPSLSRSVRSSREVWTHQLTFIWVSSWFRSREMRRVYVSGEVGTNWWAFQSRWKCSYAIHLLLFSSEVLFFLPWVYSPGATDWNMKWCLQLYILSPGFPACGVIDMCLDNKNICLRNGWHLIGLLRIRVRLEEGDHWTMLLKGISYLFISFPPSPPPFLFLFPLPFFPCFTIPPWNKIHSSTTPFLACCFLPWHRSMLKATQPANRELKLWVKLISSFLKLFLVYHSYSKIPNRVEYLRGSLLVLSRTATTRSQKFHLSPLSLLYWNG